MRYTARGAGGLSNAIPEILKDAGFGGKCELRRIESADPGMSPLQIWCNEVSLPPYSIPWTISQRCQDTVPPNVQFLTPSP